MATTLYHTEALVAAFRRDKVLPLPAVQRVLGTTSRMTVFRKLKTLGYSSSYSHAGSYYTLADIPQYDRYGVWSFCSVWFSMYGSLLNTLGALVRQSETGLAACELESIVHVRVHNALRRLCRTGELTRELLAGEYVYLSRTWARSQLTRRNETIREALLAALVTGDDKAAPEGIGEHLQAFLTILNEKQRRLYLGLESLKLGRGGDTVVANVAGVNVKTVARGRRELAGKQIDTQRVRAPGAGRPPLKKTK